MDYSLPGYSIYGMDSPGKTTGVGFSALLQRVFPTQGWNPRPSASLKVSCPSTQDPCTNLCSCVYSSNSRFHFSSFQPTVKKYRTSIKHNANLRNLNPRHPQINLPVPLPPPESQASFTSLTFFNSNVFSLDLTFLNSQNYHLPNCSVFT